MTKRTKKHVTPLPAIVWAEPVTVKPSLQPSLRADLQAMLDQLKAGPVQLPVGNRVNTQAKLECLKALGVQIGTRINEYACTEYYLKR